MKNIYLLFLCFTWGLLSSYAQECTSLMAPVSLLERAYEATTIIEGEVISSQSYWDTLHHNIYTLHEIRVYKKMKGGTSSVVYVQSMGGTVGDEMQLTSSSAKLQEGDMGIFFIKDATASLPVVMQTYELVAAAQGVIKYDKQQEKAYDPFSEYPSIDAYIIPKIQQVVGTPVQNILTRPLPIITQTNRMMAPVISGFSPTTVAAGTESLLTISGSGFGTTLGQVLFPTGNDGGATYTAAKDTQIAIWSDETIIIRVPSTAGTGTIQVTNTSGTATSTGTLSIPYSQINASSATTDFPVTIESDNGSGGVDFQYHTDFNTSAAKPFFEQAFGLWNCQSGINFQFGTTTTTDVTANDDINIVRFDNGNELPSGVLGQVTTRFSGVCNATGNAVVEELDITWNDGFNFYYGDGTPGGSQYDFKTVALHELGHAHGLAHIINTNNVMHYNLGPGVSKYELSSEDIDGANYVMTVFTDGSQCSAMTENNGCTYVPDDNFEAYLEANNLGNGIDNDDYVTTANINTLTALVISNLNIADLTGIEDFTALQNLDCSNNNLVSLDISSNTGLTNLIANDNTISTIILTGVNGLDSVNLNDNSLSSLDISNRTMLTQLLLESNSLNSLNVNGCTALEELNTNSNNAVTSLDLSTNTALKNLYIVSNSLTSLDLSSHPNLLNVDVADNDLTMLDMKNGNNVSIIYFRSVANYNLTCINVDDAALPALATWNIDAPITSFDENCYNTYVPDDNFEDYLETHDASGNTVALGDASSLGNGMANDDYVAKQKISVLTDLDISGLGITDMTGIEDFVAMEFLRANGNSFASIDISNLPQLERMWIQIGGLTALDVTNNPLLYDLRVQFNNIGSIDLTTNPLLEVLQINDNELDAIDLANNPLLWRVRVNANNLTTLDLSNQSVLRQVRAAGNGLTFMDMQNGNNTNVTEFSANVNPALSCINVDDAMYSSDNWMTIDPTTSFSEYCFEINCATDITIDADPVNCNATIAVDAPTLNGGFSKTALNFDGVNDQVVVANGFTNDLSEVTMEVKVNFDAIGGWDTLLNYTSWTTGYLHFQLDTNGRLGWSVNGNSPTDQYIDLGLQTGVWYNLAVTYSVSEKKMSFYLDGVLQDERTYSTAIPLLADKQFAIGKWSSRLLDGSIDDFRVWDTVRTETEIQAMLDKPLSGNETNLVAYYNFNEGDSCEDNIGVATIVDQTGNHSGTLSGFGLTDTMTCESNFIAGTIDDYALVNDYNNSSVLNETFLVGTTTIIWTATNLADNTIETCTQTITVTDALGTCTVSVAPIMYLQGAMESATDGLMRDDLRSGNLIPLTSPYTDALTVDQTILDITGANAIVDWVWLELRDATDNNIVIAGQSALLQRDGNIVSLDGTSDVIINEAPGDYYIVVNHRGHLGIITDQAITLSSMTTVMDFATNTTLIAGGDLSMILLATGKYAITVGDYDGNGQVQNIDLNAVKSQLGMAGYMEADMDMNGQIQTIDLNSLLIPNIGKGQSF